MKLARLDLASFLLGAAGAVALLGAGALIVIEGGLFDASAVREHLRPVAWATHTAMIRDARRQAAAIAAPGAASVAQFEAGFRGYEADCVMCHGGPGVARARWVSGMTPSPPYLVDAARQWSAPQLYWIIANGVKMTAMPAWRMTRSDAQIWDDVAFLEALPYLSPTDYARMRAADARALPKAPGSPPSRG
jgi:mono/diheme cytochrome c family protein